MKKNTTTKKSPKKALAKAQSKRIRHLAANPKLYVGIDLGDQSSRYCILDEGANVVSEGQLPTTKAGLDSLLAKMPSSRIAMEVGTH